MRKKINIPLYITGIILFTFIFKVAIADYIKDEPRGKTDIWSKSR